MAFLPLIALGVAALSKFGKYAAALAVVVTFAPTLIQLVSRPAEHSITWQESDVNSRVRRQWTERAAAYLRANVEPQDTFLTSFGDLTGIYRSAGIPLRFTLTGDNDVEWQQAITLPTFFLHTDWAVVLGGDVAQSVIDGIRLHGPRYELEQRIMVKGAPVIEIYHLVFQRAYEDPLLETTRSEERLPADDGR
jgi:hypothetical protein